MKFGWLQLHQNYYTFLIAHSKSDSKGPLKLFCFVSLLLFCWGFCAAIILIRNVVIGQAGVAWGSMVLNFCAYALQ